MTATPAMEELETEDLMGTYSKYVEKLRKRKPSLSYLSQFLTGSTSAQGPCRIASLEFIEGRKAPVKSELSFDDLCSTFIRERTCEKGEIDFDLESGVEDGTLHDHGRLQGRLLFIEDINKKTMDLLGSHLDIDPIFFAGHLHLPWNDIDAQVPDQCVLPSQARRQPFTNISHHRTVLFDEVDPPARKLLRRTNIDRKVISLPLAASQRVGMIQHCISILLSKRKTCWIGKTMREHSISQITDHTRSCSD